MPADNAPLSLSVAISISSMNELSSLLDGILGSGLINLKIGFSLFSDGGANLLSRAAYGDFKLLIFSLIMSLKISAVPASPP